MRSFGISLRGRRIATLTEAGSGSLFAYELSYREDSERAVLSQSLLDAAGRPTDRAFDDGIVPFFENLLPEVGPLRRYIASRADADPYDDFALLDLLGNNLPGAIEATLDYETPEAVASRASAPKRDPRWRFSLAGVQMKFSGTDVNGRWNVATIDEPGDWIVKLPTNEYPGIVENEFALMALARDCGLDVPEIRTIALDSIDGLDERFRNGNTAYAIKRFDRDADGRIHQEDFCQVFGLRPVQKYWGDTPRATTENVASVVAEIASSTDVTETIRRFAFNIVVGNGDAHLKNHALLYADGRTAHLAPLYDVVCTLRYRHDDEMALTIGGESAFAGVDSAALARFADGAGISRRIVRREVGEIL